MKRTLKLILVFLILSISCLAHAKNNNPGIVFIHGLGNFAELKYKSSGLWSKMNWYTWKKRAFGDLETEEILWTAKQRILPQIPNIVKQYKKILGKGHCDNGCIIVTHSTGGLVADILLSRSLESKGSTNDFSQIQESTVLSIQIASALGGTSLANSAFDWLREECRLAEYKLDLRRNDHDLFYDPMFIKIITIPLGQTSESHKKLNQERKLGKVMHSIFPEIDCNDIENTAGVFYDLQPEIAREINGSDDTGVLTLMVVGDGEGFMGNIFTPFLLKPNDGIVEMHSACGAREVLPFESCVSYINAAGEADREYSAPDPEDGFYDNHYPFIMTQENHMGQIISMISSEKEVVLNVEALAQYRPLIDTQNKKYLLDRQNNFKNIHLSEIFDKYIDLSVFSKAK